MAETWVPLLDYILSFMGLSPLRGLAFAVAETEEHWHSPRADSWGSGSMWDLGIKMEPHRECLLPKWTETGPNWAEKNSEQMWMSLKLWCLGFCGSGWNPSMPAGIVHNFICPLWGYLKPNIINEAADVFYRISSMIFGVFLLTQTR